MLVLMKQKNIIAERLLDFLDKMNFIFTEEQVIKDTIKSFLAEECTTSIRDGWENKSF